MRLKRLLRLTLIIVVVVLTACTAFKLRDANEQLTNFYNAKKQAQNNNDWGALGSAVASMDMLSEDAARQAEKEKNNVLNQIAFYRIAATAAWQAGDPNVLTYANKGKDLCTGDNFDRAPRDCGMLFVIPHFASVDEITNRFQTLHDKVKETPPDQRSAHAQAAEKIFADYQAALTSILKQRPKIATSKAHPDFLKALDHNTGSLLCDLIGFDTIGLIATAKGNVKKYKCEAYELKLKAFAAGLRKSSAKCLTDTREELEKKKPDSCE